MAGKEIPTVMIIEDDPACTYLIRRYAETSGCRAVSTEHAQEALALAKKEMPAVIMLDILMPEMNGWEVLQALKSDPATRHVPVVLCSALEEEMGGRAEGAAGYLRKPLVYDDFVLVLANVGIVKV